MPASQRNPPAPPPRPRRVLAIKNKHIGDIICVQPALLALHRSFPEAKLDVMVSPRTSELLAGHAWIDRVFEVPKHLHGLSRLAAEARLLWTVATSGYDLVVDFTWSDRAMWYALASRARDRWAIQVTAGLFFKPWIYTNYGGKPDRTHHVIEHEREFLTRMGVPSYEPEFDFPATPVENAEMQRWLEGQGVQPGRMVLVHPTSRWLFKCWHDERVAELMDWLAAQGWQPVLTCGPGPEELARARAIRSLLTHPVPDRLGDLTLRQLGALARQARFFFGMDSAPMHLAAAVGTPTVVLFGPSLVARWRPFGDHHIVLAGECPCLKVKGKLCDKSRVMDCLSGISLEQVKRSVSERFGRPARVSAT